LNAEPAPETEALLDRIRREHSDKVTRRQGDKVTDLFHPLTLSPPHLVTLLVGRLNEHTRLVGAYTAARRGHAQVVVVEGAPGIGKTHLAGAFLRWVAADGEIALHGRAIVTEDRLLCQPLIEALRGVSPAEHDLRALLSDVWLAELG